MAAGARFVLIIGDPGLRSTLVARLTLAGLSVMTAVSFFDPAIRRLGKGSAVLVLDHAPVDGEVGAWTAALEEGAGWTVVVIRPDGAELPAPQPRLRVVHRSRAMAALIDLSGAGDAT